MDLIRKILLEIEKSDDIINPKEINIEGFTRQEISYHIELLHDAGFIEGIDLNSKDGYLWFAKKLTWEGHEFLDAIKNENVWNKIKQKSSNELSTFPLKVISSVAIELTKEYAKNIFGLK